MNEAEYVELWRWRWLRNLHDIIGTPSTCTICGYLFGCGEGPFGLLRRWQSISCFLSGLPPRVFGCLRLRCRRCTPSRLTSLCAPASLICPVALQVFSVPSFQSEWFWYQWEGESPSEAVVEFVGATEKPGFAYADYAHRFE